MGRLEAKLLAEVARSDGPVVILTGAGISAESGIPTFRGEEGYWRVGSRNYQPQEMATREAFEAMPEEVWRWYLWRRAVCRAAQPNQAHRALVALEEALGDRFLLVTQNVDGLHRRAGNSAGRTYAIHGEIDCCRCWAECEPAVRALPAGIDERWDRERVLGEEERRLLRCDCGARLRPHVLWFDESYDERLFRYQSSMRAAQGAALLMVVGTSGATTLPARMCQAVATRGAPLVVVDPGETPFGALAQRSARGVFLRGTACDLVPGLTAEIAAALA
jgi:NAD-dependent deacetylase